MMTLSENTKKLILKVTDYVILPFIFVSALVMKKIRSHGLHRLPLTNAALRYVGLLPIVSGIPWTMIARFWVWI